MAAPDPQPVDCSDVEHFIYAYLDGEVAEGEKQKLEQHLQLCSPCQQQLTQAASLKRLVRRRLQDDVLAPSGLRQRIVGQLLEERPPPNHSLALWARRLSPPLAFGASVAACLSLIYARIGPHGSDRWVINDAVEVHARALPLEVSTGELRHLMPFFDQHLGFAIQPPAFPTRRISLEGGRLWHLGPHDAAYLQYDVPFGSAPGSAIGRQVSLFVVEAPSVNLNIEGARVAHLSGHDVILTHLRGHNVAVWRNHDVVYSMVSDLDDNDTLALLGAPTP